MIPIAVAQDPDIRASTISIEMVSSPYVSMNLDAWMPELYRWKAIGQTIITNHNGYEKYISFESDNIDLPTASSRWKVTSPSYPDVTFNDLRLGNWPKQTTQSIAARTEALKSAKEIREKLDVRPLTTSVMVRLLREGKEENRD